MVPEGKIVVFKYSSRHHEIEWSAILNYVGKFGGLGGGVVAESVVQISKHLAPWFFVAVGSTDS